MKLSGEFPVDRGGDEDQERWISELSAAADAELTADGYRVIARGAYVRTTLVFPQRKGARSPSMPPCMNCGRALYDHALLPSGDSACPEGGGTFNVEFQINDEAAYQGHVAMKAASLEID